MKIYINIQKKIYIYLKPKLFYIHTQIYIINELYKHINYKTRKKYLFLLRKKNSNGIKKKIGKQRKITLIFPTRFKLQSNNHLFNTQFILFPNLNTFLSERRYTHT